MWPVEMSSTMDPPWSKADMSITTRLWRQGSLITRCSAEECDSVMSMSVARAIVASHAHCLAWWERNTIFASDMKRMCTSASVH